MQKKERSSFTTGFRLLDLVIAIFCIGLLLSLFMPAVGGPKRIARRSICMNNIRQLILACHNYQSANLKFPSASGAADQNVGASFLVSILPFLDEQNVHDDYQQGIQSEELPAVLTQLSVNKIPLLYCPMEKHLDAPDFDGQNQLTTHYYASCGPNSDPDGIGYQFAYTSDKKDGDAIGLDGVFSPWSSDPADPDIAAVFHHKYGISFDAIRDGSSNTIALVESSRSENKGSGQFNRRRGWAFGHTTAEDDSNIQFVFSGNSIRYGINPESVHPGWNDQPISSNHRGGATVARADGSSSYVNEKISMEVLRAATSIDDGQPDDLE